MTGPRLSLIVWAQAAREIEEASEWWHANRLPNVRRLSLGRVGYFLFYRVDPERGEVQVLRFRHVRRRPKPMR